MRITLISPWGSPCGISVYAGDVYGELTRRGHQVQVLSYEESAPAESKADLPVHRVWRIGQPPGWRVLQHIHEFRPDVIHIQHELGFFWPGACWCDWLSCLRSTGIPVVVTYHSLPDVPNVFTDTPVSLAIVCSPIGGELLRARTDFPVTTIEHGVDGPIPPARQPEPFSLASFGFLAECKGYERILAAMRMLRSELPELTLTIMGSVTPRAFEQQLNYFHHLQRMIHESGLTGRVDLSFGFRTEREVRACLSRKAVGVLHYDRTDRLPVSADFLDSTTPSVGRPMSTYAGAPQPSPCLTPTTVSASLSACDYLNFGTTGPQPMMWGTSHPYVSWAGDLEPHGTSEALATSAPGAMWAHSRQHASQSTHGEATTAHSNYLPRSGSAGVRCQSAAVYRMWSAGLPCIVSQAQHFELGPPASQALIRARDVPQLAAEIRRLFTNSNAYQDAVSNLGKYLTRTWVEVADDHERAFAQVVQQA